jgi:hypothetical protein
MQRPQEDEYLEFITRAFSTLLSAFDQRSPDDSRSMVIS